MSYNLSHFFEEERDFLKRQGWSDLLKEQPDTPDPHADRLIDAFAILVGRLRARLDDEFPQLSEGLLQSLDPQLLAPVPSMAVARFATEPSVGGQTVGYPVGQGTYLVATTQGARRCIFRTANPVTVWPIECHAKLLPTSATKRPGNSEVRAGGILRLKLTSQQPFAQLAPQSLRFFINAPKDDALTLYYLLACQVLDVALARSENDEKPVWVTPAALTAGLGKHECVLPRVPRSLGSLQLLRQFFACPSSLLFFELNGLDGKNLEGFGGELVVQVYLRELPAPTPAVRPDTIELGCTPIVNLSPRDSELIALDPRRTEQPVHFVHEEGGGPVEVYSIDGLKVFPLGGDAPQHYHPFYASSGRGEGAEATGSWYAVRHSPGTGGWSETSLILKPRKEAVAQGRMRVSTTVLDAEVFDSQWAGDPPSLSWPSGESPPLAVTCLTPPSVVRRPERDDRSLWRLIARLSQNHHPLGGEDGKEALKNLLSVCDPGGSAVATWLSDLREVKTRRMAGRVWGDEASSHVWGTEVTLVMDRASVRDLYLFGSVLEQFLGRYCGLNSFTQLVIRGKDTDKAIGWPARAGSKGLL